MGNINNAEYESVKKEFIKEIERYTRRYYKKIEDECEKAGKNDKLKLINAYCLVLFNYSKEVVILINHDQFISFYSLTRDFLECYSIISEMIRLYDNNDKFKKFEKYLIAEDLIQTIKILKELGKTNDKSCDNNLTYIKDRLNEYFLDTVIQGTIISKEYIESLNLKNINEIQNKLCNEYKKQYPKTKFIYKKLKGNYFADNFSSESALYGMLCNYTHMNLSSIVERTITIENDGKPYFKKFKKPDLNNILNILQIIENCLHDVYIKVIELMKQK